MSETTEQSADEGRRLRRREPRRPRRGYGFRKIRRALGVTAFGVNAIVHAALLRDRPPLHEEQEELYFVHSGRIAIELRRRHRATSSSPGGLRLGRRPDRPQDPQPQRLRRRRLRRRRRQGRLRRPRRHAARGRGQPLRRRRPSRRLASGQEAGWSPVELDAPPAARLDVVRGFVAETDACPASAHSPRDRPASCPTQG